MSIVLLRADARAIPVADESIQCVVTSPPYWGLRKYEGDQEAVWGGDKACAHDWSAELVRKTSDSYNVGFNERWHGNPVERKKQEASSYGEIPNGSFCAKCGAWHGGFGLEPTIEMYVDHSIEILREVRRVLRKDGVVFWNVGDSYAGSGTMGSSGSYGSPKQASVRGSYFATGQKRNFGSIKPKDLCLIPARVAIAAQQDGWWVRSLIIWAKPNPMPESVTDRPTDAYEHIIMLAKSECYFFDADAVREPSAGWNGNKFGGERKESIYRNLGTGPRNEQSGTRNVRNVWEFATQPFNGAKMIADYVGDDGKPYIASASCPRHGHLVGSGKSKTVGGDEPPNPDAHHSSGNASDLVPMHANEPASTRTRDADRIILANSSVQTYKNNDDCKTSVARTGESKKSSDTNNMNVSLDDKLDSNAREGKATATAHSKRTRKRDRAVETTDAYSASEGTLFGKSDNEVLSENSERISRSDASNILVDSGEGETEISALEQIHYGISGSARCNCTTVGLDHFATFPEELPRRCILAATSAKGACAQCGAPWERIVRAEGGTIGQDWNSNPERGAMDYELGHHTSNAMKEADRDGTYTRKEIGWRPTCLCKGQRGKTVPCRVLDPFGGSGTTGRVAIELNREAILLDLHYHDISKRRTTNVQRRLL